MKTFQENKDNLLKFSTKLLSSAHLATDTNHESHELLSPIFLTFEQLKKKKKSNGK